MTDSFLELSPAAIVDSSDFNLHVSNIETGRVLDFTKETETFFSFFEKPRRPSQYFTAAEITSEEEREKVLKIVNLLLQEEIFIHPKYEVSEEEDVLPVIYEEPVFLQEGRKSPLHIESAWIERESSTSAHL